MTVKELTWSEAKFQIGKVDADLLELLENFVSGMSPERISQMPLLECHYNFGDRVIDEGNPKLPNHENWPEKYIISQRLPLGLVVESSLQVVDEHKELIHLEDPLSELTQAILAPGMFLGLFEALDRHILDEDQPLPDWTIFAGIPAATAAEDIFSNTVKLTRFLGGAKRTHSPDQAKARRTFGERCMLCASVLKDAASWRASVIYFSAGWVSALTDNSESMVGDGGSFLLSREKLRNYLLEHAWASAYPIRSVRSSVPRRFFANCLPDKTGKARQKDRNVSQAAYQVYASVTDILSGRRPLHFSGIDDTKFGPYDSIRERALGENGYSRTIFFPDFHSHQTMPGYIALPHLSSSFSHIPGNTGGGPMAEFGALRDRVRSAMERLFVSLRSDETLGGQEMIDYFSSIMFRISRGGGPTVFRFDLDAGNNLVTVELSDAEFFKLCGEEVIARGHPVFARCACLPPRGTRKS